MLAGFFPIFRVAGARPLSWCIAGGSAIVIGLRPKLHPLIVLVPGRHLCGLLLDECPDRRAVVCGLTSVGPTGRRALFIAVLSQFAQQSRNKQVGDGEGTAWPKFERHGGRVHGVCDGGDVGGE